MVRQWSTRVDLDSLTYKDSVTWYLKKSYLNNNLIKSMCLLYDIHCGVTSGFIFPNNKSAMTHWNCWYQNQVHTETCFPIGLLDNLLNCLAYHWTIKDESHWMTGYLMWPKIEGYQILVYAKKKCKKKPIQQTFLFWLDYINLAII